MQNPQSETQTMIDALNSLQRPDETYDEWTARTGGTAAIPDPFASFR